MINIKKQMTKATLALLLLVFGFYQARSQSVPFINIPVDPSLSGMGGISLSSENTPFAIYYNSAFMSLSNVKGGIGASFSLWQPKSTNNTLSTVTGYGKIGDKFAVGIGARYLTSPSYEVSDINGVITGIFTPKNMSVDLGLSYLLMPGLALGATVKYITSDIGGPQKGVAYAADLSAVYRLKGVHLGLYAKNIGSKISYGGSEYNLPANIGVGGSYKVSLSDIHSIEGALEGSYLLYEKGIATKIGVKYSFKEFLSICGGYHYGLNDTIVPKYATLGIGINPYKGARISISYLLTSKDSPLKNTLSASLGWVF